MLVVRRCFFIFTPAFIGLCSIALGAQYMTKSWFSFQFLAYEVGSEAALVQMWALVSAGVGLLLPASACLVSVYRRHLLLGSTGFLISVVLVIQLPPLAIWGSIAVIEASEEGLRGAGIHAVTAILSLFAMFDLSRHAALLKT